MLTVSRRAAETAVSLVKSGVTDMDELLAGALETAEETLAQTVEMNPVLKKAGVVDAGGQGYVVILTAMLQCLRGEFVAKAPVPETKDRADFNRIDDEEITFTYCTEFIVARERDRSPELLRSYLESIGDSLVLVEDDDIIKVHVHTDAPGRALTEALRYGALQTVKIENMRNQHTTLVSQETAPDQPAPAEAPCSGVSPPPPRAPPRDSARRRSCATLSGDAKSAESFSSSPSTSQRSSPLSCSMSFLPSSVPRTVCIIRFSSA